MSHHTPLRLEFAPGARSGTRKGLALLLLALLVFGWLAVQAGRGLQAHAQQREALSALASPGKPAKTKPQGPIRSDPTEAARAQWVRQTSNNLMTPWADLFAALESAPGNVALLVVEPSAAKRSVSLTAEAAGLAEMLNYVKALQNDVRLSNVVLVSHALQPQTPGSPLRFQLRANWGGEQP